MKNWKEKEVTKGLEADQKKEEQDKDGSAPAKERTEKRWDKAKESMKAKGDKFKAEKKAKGEKLKAHELMYPAHGRGEG